MKKFLSALLVTCLLTGCGGSNVSSTSSEYSSLSSQEQPTEYNNPVWEPVLADPSIIRGEDGVFYAYGTSDTARWGTDYGLKYVPVLSSVDLVHWEFRNSAFPKAKDTPSWGTMGAGIWAPDIVKIGDKYLLYYSLSTWGDADPGIGVATSDSPLGPFTDQGKLFLSSEIGVANSIDPSVFVDDGHVYMAWGSFVGIYLVELTSDGLGLLNGVEYQSNHKILLAGTTSSFNLGNYEGAYLRKVNNYYYLFLSTGSCCAGFSSTYKVVVARSESIGGPYLDQNGNDMAMQQNKGTLVVTANERFVGVGHNAMIEDDAGDYYLVYHGYDTTKDAKEGTTNRRSLLIEKLIWTEGWPHTKDYGTSENARYPIINL
jgi:arabinan endo-1,5-alpha-L-arabinosidase